MMVKKSISVTGQQNDWIKAQIETGQYGNDSELIRELIRERQQKEQQAEGLAYMKAQIQAAIDDPRPPVPIDEAFERVRSNLKKRFESK